MTWRDLITAVEGMQHRIVRLAGDQAALAFVLTEAGEDGLASLAKATNVPIPNARTIAVLTKTLADQLRTSGREADRIARELAQLVEVVERVKPDESEDTGVLELSAVADVGESE